MSARPLDFPDPADPPREGGFTRTPGDVELIHRPEGFSGAISLPLLPDLIQIYTISMANGALTIRRGGEQGTIWFDRGEMVHAVCGALIGEEAVYRLLQWHNGNFSLDPNAQAPARSITASWQNVLMEGVRLLDEEAAKGTPEPEAFADLERTVGGVLAIGVFERDGTLLAQRNSGLDLSAVGADLSAMLRRHAAVMAAMNLSLALVDCFWTLGDQVHLIQPLPSGRVLYLAADREKTNLAVLRRAIERVAEALP